MLRAYLAGEGTGIVAFAPCSCPCSRVRSQLSAPYSHLTCRSWVVPCHCMPMPCSSRLDRPSPVTILLSVDGVARLKVPLPHVASCVQSDGPLHLPAPSPCELVRGSGLEATLTHGGEPGVHLRTVRDRSRSCAPSRVRPNGAHVVVRSVGHVGISPLAASPRPTGHTSEARHRFVRGGSPLVSGTALVLRRGANVICSRLV